MTRSTQKWNRDKTLFCLQSQTREIVSVIEKLYQTKGNTMSLREIIAREEDRVFAVDSECYIIFTGDSVQDNKPFIRIGNWIDLPAGIIPLTENIIITDSMTGNPSHEQFNIDIKYLPTNRYIGSHRALERYLDFQKAFGLNLHTASVVDAEEVPEISKMNVSDRESFIGVFYRDGNFKVMHKGIDIFDLSAATSNSPNDNRINDRLASQAKARRYAGTGFVIAGDCPLFYRANNFASYLFPHEYFSSFYALGISPKQIETVIYPSENFLHLGRFLKWKHARGTKLSLFCDTEEVAMLKTLFEKAKIQESPFAGMRHEVSSGFNISSINRTCSIRLTAEHPSTGKIIHTAFIKGPGDIKYAAKEKFDIIITPCQAYSESSAHFRSMNTPVAVIDDGSPSASRIPLLDTTLLRKEMQYDIEPVADDSSFLEKMSAYLPEETIFEILKKDPSASEELCKAGISGHLSGEDAVRYFNTLSLLKFLFNATTDRKLSSILKNSLPSALSSASRAEVYKMPFTHRIDLLLLNGIVYEFAAKLMDPAPADTVLLDDIHASRNITKTISDASDRAFYKKITEDRIRLERLLALFSNSAAFRADVLELKEAMSRRKELFKQETLQHPKNEKGFIGRLKESSDKESGIPADATGVQGTAGGSGKTGLSGSIGSTALSSSSTTALSASGTSYNKTSADSGKTGGSYADSVFGRNLGRKGTVGGKYSSGGIFSIASIKEKVASIPKPVKIAVLLIIAAAVISLLTFAGSKGYTSYKADKKIKAEKIETERRVAEKKRIVATYSVTVSEYDIYKYANEIAVKNGYAPIEAKNLQKRNPHWIYPGNEFILPDGIKVTVKDRDTLWDIARDRLEQKYVEFFKLYEALKKDISAGKKADALLMQKAHNAASKEEHLKLLRGIETNGTK